jgi:hypothetical protein
VPAAAAISNLQIPFEDRDYTTQQTLLILATGKTNFFENILPHLEHYLDGNRLKITGRSIKEYRERKLAEPRRKRPTGQLPNTRKRRSREIGSAP